jgi:hypothetical protein
MPAGLVAIVVGTAIAWGAHVRRPAAIARFRGLTATTLAQIVALRMVSPRDFRASSQPR